MAHKLSFAVVVSICVNLIVKTTDGQAGTLGFYLNGTGTAHSNGSTVLRTDIGKGVNALLCTTDNTTCCDIQYDVRSRPGEFYFPNGTQVPGNGLTPGNQTDGYYRTRGSQLIRLNRNTAGTITGLFRCEIPDASGTMVNLFINIVNGIISVSITSSGTDTAGESYSLVCTATVNGTIEQPTITWSGPGVTAEMITTTGSMSILTFNPLAASHAGTYTCTGFAGGVTGMVRDTVTVNDVSHCPTTSHTTCNNHVTIIGQAVIIVIVIVTAGIPNMAILTVLLLRRSRSSDNQVKRSSRSGGSSDDDPLSASMGVAYVNVNRSQHGTGTGTTSFIYNSNATLSQDGTARHQANDY